jgi:hypothetical protein
MKRILTLFILAVFALFMVMEPNGAEATLSLDTSSLIPDQPEESVATESLAPTQEMVYQRVANVLKWPNEPSTANHEPLDVQALIGTEISAMEGGSGRGGILRGGESRAL